MVKVFQKTFKTEIDFNFDMREVILQIVVYTIFKQLNFKVYELIFQCTYSSVWYRGTFQEALGQTPV